MIKSKIESSIFLIDSSSVDYFLKHITNYKKIITFDYDSHIKLNKNKIDHITSDDFITPSEFTQLDKQSLTFSTWYKENELSDCLIYKKINLGQLFYIDFFTYFIPLFKNFFEINKIYLFYKTENFVAPYNLYKILNKFTNNVKLLKKETSEPVNYYLDSLDYKFQIKDHSFKLSLTKNKFEKLKFFTENFLKNLFHKKLNDNQKSHLLIEFDSIKFKNLFNTFPDSCNFISYNRRRPTIWNLESYSIIKNSNSYFFTENELLNNEVKQNILNSEVFINNTLSCMNKHDQNFKKFFSFSETNLWLIIKDSFFDLCKFRFKELIKEIELAEQLFKKIKFSSVLIWSENGTTEQIISHFAKINHIPIILLQHGLYYDHHLAKNMNTFQGVLPINSDIFAVWGNEMNNFSKNMSLDSKKIQLIGSPSLETIFKINKQKLEQNYILVATQGPTNNSIYDLDIKLIEKYVNTIKEICNITTKLNENLIFKLHPDPHEMDIENIVNSINPSIKVIKSGSITDLIKNCKIFVTIDISTTILEAQILEKPVISISVKNYQVGDAESQVFLSNSCIHTDIENFQSHLSKIIHDENFKKILIQNGLNFVDDYLINKKNSSKCLIELLEKL
jgi:hypothetical protein